MIDLRKTRFHRQAALLLEVVVALALMIGSLAMLGAQLRSGILTMQTAEEMNRGVALVDRLLALMELDLELQQRLFEDQERDGDFGEQYPGYFWILELEPLEQTELSDEPEIDEDSEDLPLLYRVDIKILYDRPGEEDPEGTLEDARELYTVHMIRATPPSINMTEDLGIPSDQLEQLQQVLPDFDPEFFNPQALITQLSTMVEEDPASLMALAPMIQQLMQQFAPGAAGGNDQGLQALLGLVGGGLGGGGAQAGGGDLQAGLDQLRSLQGQLGGAAGGGNNRAGGGAGRPGNSSTPRAAPERPGSNNMSGGQEQDALQQLMELRDSLQRGGGN